MTDAVLQLDGVHKRYGATTALGGIDLAVHPGERWLVLGRNGSGKSTLIQIAALYEHPSEGAVHVLGELLGKTDVRSLRTRIGLSSAALTEQLRAQLSVADIVMTAKHAALEPWWHSYDAADRARADHLLGQVGCAGFGDRVFATLSSGERQRVQLARTLMSDPALLLLDEPTAALDLAGREELVGALTAVADTSDAPPSILVTHHVEEIPDGITHAMLLRGGVALAQGELDDVLTADALSDCFGIALKLARRDGRWTAWAPRC